MFPTCRTYVRYQWCYIIELTNGTIFWVVEWKHFYYSEWFWRHQRFHCGIIRFFHQVYHFSQSCWRHHLKIYLISVHRIWTRLAIFAGYLRYSTRGLKYRIFLGCLPSFEILQQPVLREHRLLELWQIVVSIFQFSKQILRVCWNVFHWSIFLKRHL